jgi:hypothetical protein
VPEAATQEKMAHARISLNRIATSFFIKKCEMLSVREA